MRPSINSVLGQNFHVFVAAKWVVGCDMQVWEFKNVHCSFWSSSLSWEFYVNVAVLSYTLTNTTKQGQLACVK